MKLVQKIAVLAFGGAFLAGCNPNADQADTTTDETAAPAAPADMPATTPETGTVPGPDETMTPPTDPAYLPPPSDGSTPADPNQEPAPPPDQ
jgi:hypothetical protein